MNLFEEDALGSGRVCTRGIARPGVAAFDPDQPFYVSRRISLWLIPASRIAAVTRPMIE